MSAVLVDSNVILDVVTEDPKWGDWSSAAMERVADESSLVINPLVYSEVSMGFDRIEELESALPANVFLREPLPYEAAFLVGKAFLQYRRPGGARGSPLPDFHVGAHAAIAGYALLTRDARRYRSYFPTVRLIAP